MFREEVQPFEIGLESLVNASCEVLPFSLVEPLLQPSTNLVKHHVKKTMIHPVKNGKKLFYNHNTANSHELYNSLL